MTQVQPLQTRKRLQLMLQLFAVFQVIEAGFKAVEAPQRPDRFRQAGQGIVVQVLGVQCREFSDKGV